MIGETAVKAVDEYAEELRRTSRAIWEHPEDGFKEYFASDRCAELLEKNGFQIERGYAKLPTAIRASWGHGHPVIGFLGEFDALPGLSQKDVNHQDPIEDQEFGHGCGHNLICVGMIGAVLAAKREMEAENLEGTVVFYACPAEEKTGGKVYMAREGAFRELDCAFAWHPGRYNQASYSVSTGTRSTVYHFKGIPAHAAADAEKGRSALDAVELMNVGVNYLREHVPYDVRMHYIIKDGGKAPNIVPEDASVWYFDRALHMETMRNTERRIRKIAEGAAWMTETTMHEEVLGGCYPILPNHALGKLADECMRQIPQEPWTDEEIAYVREINAANPEYVESCKALYGNFEHAPQLHSGVKEIDTADDFGSTDVGDVSNITPTTYYKTAAYGICAPAHTWQVTACVGRSIGQKGMLYASKIGALAAVRLMTEPELMAQVRSEFEESTRGKVYQSLLPPDAAAPV